MTTTGRIMVFIVAALSIWTAMHVYVASRLWNLPSPAGTAWHRGLLVAMILLGASFPLGQLLGHWLGRAAAPAELVGVTWVGILFLLMVALLDADLLTGFGYLLPSWSRTARLVALAAAGGLSVVALLQGLRGPVVEEYAAPIHDLRPEYEGLRIVQLSDLHLGPFLRTRWIEARLAQVAALRPDLIVVTGDLVDQDARLSEPLVPSLRKLQAPLGVWGVTGNHEFYAGLDRSLAVFRNAGVEVLRDRWVEVAPGLVLAGVDDLTARRQFGVDGHPVERSLLNRPGGTTLFLSHSPSHVERAAELGADLMLSGHTHAGQIWPFSLLVRLMYPYVAGEYHLDGMTLIVSRGTGFWGPPMRLFRPAEISVITLKRA